MRAPSLIRKALCAATLAACGLLLQGCSTVKLAYNQVPHLAYWQLNSYLGLSETQTERVRDELVKLLSTSATTSSVRSQCSQQTEWSVAQR